MATQPVEDIEAVLGRFQAWTGTREAAGVKAGIREMSDEEALASGRYRWRPERTGTVKPAAAPVQPSVSPVSPSAPVRGRTKAAATKETSQKPSVRKQQKNRAAAREEPQTRSSARTKEETRPAFREVLAEAVEPAKPATQAQVIVKPQPVELSRQVAISIRLAPSERALIKARATEAGITASAYIRQCALEVEQLREQVRQAVASMECGTTPTGQVVASTPARGFWGWMVRKFLPRRSPALALRA